MNLCGRPPYQKGHKPAAIPAMRNAARGQACALMIPGVCNGNSATTVGAHLRWFNYRGPICIHASASGTLKAFRLAACDIYNSGCHYMPSFDGVRRGGIIGTAEIVGCVDHSDSPWFFGPHGLILRNVQPVRFIPVKGALGLFRWKDKLTKGVEA